MRLFIQLVVIMFLSSFTISYASDQKLVPQDSIDPELLKIIKVEDFGETEGDIRLINVRRLNLNPNYEIILIMGGNNFCGTGGCNKAIYIKENNKWRLLMGLERESPTEMDETVNDWHNIMLYSRGTSKGGHCSAYKWSTEKNQYVFFFGEMCVFDGDMLLGYSDILAETDRIVENINSGVTPKIPAVLLWIKEDMEWTFSAKELGRIVDNYKIINDHLNNNPENKKNILNSPNSWRGNVIPFQKKRFIKD